MTKRLAETTRSGKNDHSGDRLGRSVRRSDEVFSIPVRQPGPIGRMSHLAGLLALCVLVACLAVGCSSGRRSSTPKPPPTSTSAPDPNAATKDAVLKAWRAAEDAFYQAEADPRGVFSAALDATMVDPELQLVRRNLAADEHSGFIGRGAWDLGAPRVTSLTPGDHPTKATVVSCIHDTQVLVDEKTGQPSSGPSGTPDWLGATSTMVLTDSGWKLSDQSGVANTDRAIACAGLAT